MLKIINKEEEKKFIVSYLNKLSNGYDFTDIVNDIDKSISNISDSFFDIDKFNNNLLDDLSEERELYLNKKYPNLKFVISYDDMLSLIWETKYALYDLSVKNKEILTDHFSLSSTVFFNNYRDNFDFKKNKEENENIFEGTKINRNLSIECINYKKISLNKQKNMEMLFQKIYTHLFEIDIINNTNKLIEDLNLFSKKNMFSDLESNVENMNNLKNQLKENFIMDLIIGISDINKKKLNLKKISYTMDDLIITNNKIKERYKEETKKAKKIKNEKNPFEVDDLSHLEFIEMIDDIISDTNLIKEESENIKDFINKKIKRKKLGIKIVK